MSGATYNAARKYCTCPNNGAGNTVTNACQTCPNGCSSVLVASFVAPATGQQSCSCSAIGGRYSGIQSNTVTCGDTASYNALAGKCECIGNLVYSISSLICVAGPSPGVHVPRKRASEHAVAQKVDRKVLQNSLRLTRSNRFRRSRRGA